MDEMTLRYRNAMRRPYKGFTMVELLVVIAIVGILVSMAIPQYTQYRAGRMVNALSSSLASSFRLARSEALRRGREVTICRTDDPDAARPSCASANGDWTTGWVVFEDAPPLSTIGADDTIIKVEPPSTNKGNITTNTNFTLTYHALGLPIRAGVANTTLSVLPPVPASEQNSSTLGKDVIISATGRISVNKHTP